jgi:ABC-type ATPase involved in cell division
METALRESLGLTEDQYKLLLEILEREQVKLPVEIRHTVNRSYRDELKRRLQIVDQLVERLRPAA